MKKNIFSTAIAALLAGMTLTGCSDFLDAENKSAGGQTTDAYFGKDVSSLLASAYSSFDAVINQVPIYEQGTDLYINTRGHAAGEFNEYSMTPANGTIESYYKNAYKAINYANAVIFYADASSKESQEARFLRNWGYYLLTQQFGSVPYITEYLNTPERNYPRTDLNEVYTSVIADLTDLYNNSSLDAASNHQGRASKQAVAALLAKVCLAAGWDIDTSLDNAEQGTYTVKSTSRFTEAASWAEKAINGISLTMSFEDKWSPKNEGNAEEIFSIIYERANYPGDETSGGHSRQNDFGGYYGNCVKLGLKNVGSDNQQSEKSMYLFEKGDKRYEGTFMTTLYNAELLSTGDAGWGTDGYYAYYNLDAAKLASQPIANRFYPFYTTEAEAVADIEAHAKQMVQGNCTNGVIAAILSSPVIKYTFDKNGKYTKSSISVAEYNTQVNNGVCVKKFDDPESAQVAGSNDYRDLVVFHVSDMYLVAAEAYLMAGQTAQALEKLNAVRKRAGLANLTSFNEYTVEYSTPSSFTLRDIDVILDERARELYAEGHRWIDLRRTKQLIRYNVAFNMYINTASQMADVAGNYKWLRPIPENEISSNTGITVADQNPGYGGIE